MLLGVVSYQLIVSLVSSYIATLDQRESERNIRFEAVNNFALRYELPTSTHKRMLEHFKNIERKAQHDFKQLISELPLSIQHEITLETYGKVLNSILFLKEKPHEFQLKII